jgi:hypothetical protein
LLLDRRLLFAVVKPMMAVAPASSLGPTSMHWRTHVLHALQQQNEEEAEPFRGIIQSCKCLRPRIALLPLPVTTLDV